MSASDRGRYSRTAVTLHWRLGFRSERFGGVANDLAGFS